MDLKEDLAHKDPILDGDKHLKQLHTVTDKVDRIMVNTDQTHKVPLDNSDMEQALPILAQHNTVLVNQEVLMETLGAHQQDQVMDLLEFTAHLTMVAQTIKHMEHKDMVDKETHTETKVTHFLLEISQQAVTSNKETINVILTEIHPLEMVLSTQDHTVHVTNKLAVMVNLDM